MSDADKIKMSVERTKKALSLKPVLGKGTGVSKASITNGLTCEIQEGKWKFVADMPESVGGNAAGPTPGVYGRAALASCLAIGYMMKAAEMNIPIHLLEVEVHADYDDGALFGTAEKSIPSGYLEVRYTVNIESNTAEEKIMHMLNDADEHSPYLDIFSRAQKCRRQINIVSPKTVA
jgi:uncharacterized OsmC-like protein